jgi:riboflavin transporter FmnP
MLAAVSVVLIILNFPLPFFPPYLKYDFADVSILVGTFAFGPVAGVLITLISSFIQSFFVAGDAPYGFIMHAIATSSLVIVSGVIYHFWKTRKGAVIALVCGTLAMTGAMLLANHFITPFYLSDGTKEAIASTRAYVDTLLLPQILPFNLLKAGINSVITFIVYKAVSKYIVHGEKFGKGKSSTSQA